MKFSVLALCSLVGTALCQVPRQGFGGSPVGINLQNGLNGFGGINGFIDFDIDHPLSDVDSSVLAAQRFMGSGSPGVGMMGQSFGGPQGFSGQQDFGMQQQRNGGQQRFDGPQGLSGSVSGGSQGWNDGQRGQISSRGQINARADFNSRDSFLSSGRNSADSLSLTDLGTRSGSRTSNRNGLIVEQSQFSSGSRNDLRPLSGRSSFSRSNVRLPQRSTVDSRRSNFGTRNLGTSRRISLGSRNARQIPQRGMFR